MCWRFLTPATAVGGALGTDSPGATDPLAARRRSVTIMFNESLGYLRQSDDWVKTVLIGGVLSLLGFLLVPAFLVFGYAVRVLRATMVGDETPPEFGDWGDLTVDGLKAFAVAIVYSLVPAIVMAVFGGLGVLGIVLGSGDGGSGLGAALGGLTAFLGVVLGLLLSLAAAYVVPAALANFAETGRVGAAFDVGELRPVLTSGAYATAWAVGFAIIVGAGVVTSVLNVVPFLGFVVGAFVSFYALVAAYHAVGTAWGQLHPVAVIGEGDASAERPAI